MQPLRHFQPSQMKQQIPLCGKGNPPLTQSWSPQHIMPYIHTYPHDPGGSFLYLGVLDEMISADSLLEFTPKIEIDKPTQFWGALFVSPQTLTTLT